jgi:hypothetical protein
MYVEFFVPNTPSGNGATFTPAASAAFTATLAQVEYSHSAVLPIKLTAPFPFADEYLQPRGLLDTAYFLGVDAVAMINGWSSTAYKEVQLYGANSTDLAIMNYVYWRGFSYIADRLAMEPDSLSAAGISRSIGQGRVDYFRKMAKNYENFWLEQTGRTPKNRFVETSAWVPVKRTFI